VAFGSAGFFATLLSQRIRDIALFVLMCGAVVVTRMDVTFMGMFWYRGTSRGIEISALDVLPACLLVATLLLPRYPRGRFYWPASLGLMLVYFVYCCVSVGTSEPQVYGVWELTKILRGILVFLAAALFIRTRRELAIVVGALCLAVILEGSNALEQRFLKGAFRTPGTFEHENTFSTYLVMVGPVLLAAAMSKWSVWLRWFAGVACLFAAGAELLTLSRLGVPAFALVMIGTALACSSWRITLQKAVIGITAAIVVGAMVIVSWDGLKARYAQSNIRAELFDEKAVETRGVYWRLALAMVEDHPHGVGLNNWSYYVAKTYGPALGYAYSDYDEIKWVPDRDDAYEIFHPPAADSLPALTLGELGLTGLIVFLAIWLRWFQMGAVFLRGRLNDDPMHRMALGLLFGTLGIFLQSTTEWTYRQTSVMFTFHVMMGALAGLYRARRMAIKAAKAERTAAEEVVQEPLMPQPSVVVHPAS
jgi:hypothetical protein